ncbi:MAG: redoxin domain-containing protein [Muribaculaceae bacterium]|nr:redoxin domain-containing protein [Muribaculaceae bacterium]
MKKFVYIILVAVLAVACSSKGDYKITVTFPDASYDGDTLFLTSYDSGDTLSQAVVANACAAIDGEVEGSFMARLLVHGERMGFVVEKGKIAILWQDGLATGTHLNQALNDLDKRLEELGDNDSLMVEAFNRAYHENVNNAIGPWAFNYYLMYNEFSSAQIDSLLKELPAGYRDLKRVQKAIKFAGQHELTAPGKPYSDFSNSKGEKLSDHISKDKINIVDFWASWCGPCRREIPNLQQIVAKYGDKVNVVGVAVWDKPDDTHKAMGELNITWPVIEGGANWTEPTDLYGVSGIPHILVIAGDTIVDRGLQGEELTHLVEKLVANKQ